MPGYRKNDSLIEARKQAKLTIKEAAKGIGIDWPRYSGYENGRLYPSEEAQEKICNFYRSRGIFLFEDDVFPKELKGLAKKEYIPKKEPETPPEIVYLPPSQIRFLSDHNHAGMSPEYDIEKAVMKRELSERAGKILASLIPREEKVLQMRFGIGERYEHTLKEIGKEFDITRESIRRIEAKAITKLWHPSRANKLKAFLDNEE
ncbi:MAG: sigma-70 family RNA polymerase sigma factor [Methanotrichaceae archaeon]|nr:sigma-70 family RNA polymerase sigma factor [Methanotrichaceae archaeon]